MNTALAIFFFMVSYNYHSPSKEDCIKGDWFKFGKKDAYFGFKSNRFNHHKKICSKFNITPNENQYANGRNEGLKLFCTESRGYHWGRTNKENPKICPMTTKKIFLKGFKRGHRDRNGRN